MFYCVQIVLTLSPEISIAYNFVFTYAMFWKGCKAALHLQLRGVAPFMAMMNLLSVETSMILVKDSETLWLMLVVSHGAILLVIFLAW